MRTPVQRRPITDLVRERVAALLGVKLHGYDGFARRLVLSISGDYERGVTEAEAKQVARLAWTYRRQIAAKLHPPAPPESSPTYRQLIADQQRLQSYMAERRAERTRPNI